MQHNLYVFNTKYNIQNMQLKKKEKKNGNRHICKNYRYNKFGHFAKL